MDISILFIRVIFIAIPGVISNRIYRILKGYPSQKDWEDLIDIVLFSVLAYGIYGLVINALTRLGYPVQSVTAFQAAIDDKTPINLYEVCLATLIGIIVAIVAGYVSRFRLINKVGFFIGAGDRIGAGRVWNGFHRNFAEDWVFVRDHKLDLTYFCKIVIYSADDQNTTYEELVLRDVEVYSNVTGDFLYDCKLMYLARDIQDITIEEPLESVSEDNSLASSETPQGLANNIVEDRRMTNEEI